MKKTLLACAIVMVTMTSCSTSSRMGTARAGSAIDDGNSAFYFEEPVIRASEQTLKDARAAERFEFAVWWFDLLIGFIGPGFRP